jgi:transglutaminase superfamily protein
MKSFLFILVLLFTATGFCENYLLNGGQSSTIKYKMTQKVEPQNGIVTVNLSYVIPQSFDSPTYNQQIKNFDITFNINPADKKEWIDQKGNKIVKYSWNAPSSAIDIILSFEAINRVQLNPVTTQASFPLNNLAPENKIYIESSKFVPVNNHQIKNKALQITRGAKTEFDAVQKILSYVIDHMHYVLKPEEYGALYSFQSGKGNCQNYSHLSAALMRAVGIPVRIVNGVTLKKPFDVKVGEQILTLNMAEGRHSWIEVYFPDLGWMPFDPQQSELFVSNRFIRIEVGMDNNETTNDGLVKWTRTKGSNAMISFQEFIESSFISDDVNLNAEKMKYGPGKLLLVPKVLANYVPVKLPEIKKKKEFLPDELFKLKYDKPFLFGNLDFPEGANFTFSRELEKEIGSDSQQLKKNFLVETAEYVTSKLQYAQTFILSNPIKLQKIGIALNKFGGSGTMWLELFENDNGKPGALATKSKILNLSQISSKQGYFWEDFDFSDQGLLLTPDRYWIVLKYDGSPIVNWFYSYGKPVGPIDGTRYKSISENNWSKSLGYEFNYRVIGQAAE